MRPVSLNMLIKSLTKLGYFASEFVQECKLEHEGFLLVSYGNNYKVRFSA